MARLKPLYIIDPEALFESFTKDELEAEYQGLREERACIAMSLKQVESDLYAVRSLIVKANCEERGVQKTIKKRPFEGLTYGHHWAHK